MERAKDILSRSGVTPIKPYLQELSDRRKKGIVESFLLQKTLLRLLNAGIFINLIHNTAPQLQKPSSSELIPIQYSFSLGFHYKTGNPQITYIPTMPEIDEMITQSGKTFFDFIIDFVESARHNVSHKKGASEFVTFRNTVLSDQQDISSSADDFLTLILVKDYIRASRTSIFLIPDVDPYFEEIAIAYLNGAHALMKEAGSALDKTFIDKHLVMFYKKRVEKLLSQDSNTANTSPEDTLIALSKSLNIIGNEFLSPEDREKINQSVRKHLLPRCLLKLLRLGREIAKSKTDSGSIEEMKQAYDTYKRNLIALARFFGEDIADRIIFVESNITL